MLHTYVQIITLSNINTACYYMIVNIIVGFGYTKQELIIRILEQSSLFYYTNIWLHIINLYKGMGASAVFCYYVYLWTCLVSY